MRWSTLLLALALGSSAMACSGRNIGPLMARATELGRSHHLTVIVILLVALLLSFPGKFRSPALAFLAGEALIHPNLWVSAYRGDCGSQLQSSSLAFTIAALLAFAWHVGFLARSARSERGAL